jgi:hypothetical protein
MAICGSFLGGWHRLRGAACGLLTILALSAFPESGLSAAQFAPTQPQPSPDMLLPGLNVGYVFLQTRWVDTVEAVTPDGFAKGPPLPALDYSTGTGNVLTSGQDNFVGAHITGYIKLAAAGRYRFIMLSNDGVRVRLNGTVIISDPGVHPDHGSDVAIVDAAQPGWYRLEIHYFERKNTSTLRLFWAPPQALDFYVVPAQMYARDKVIGGNLAAIKTSKASSIVPKIGPVTKAPKLLSTETSVLAVPSTRIVDAAATKTEPATVASSISRFEEPRTGSGQRLYACTDDDEGCGKPVADAFCQQQGFATATAFNTDRRKGPAQTLEGAYTCTKKKCKVFDFITCGSG